MAEVDPIQWILPMIVAIIVPFILLSISRVTKTSEGTISGTIRLEGVKSNVDELKTGMEKGFDKLEAMLNQKAQENRDDFDSIKNRMQELAAMLNLHEYRIEQLEKMKSNRSAV